MLANSLGSGGAQLLFGAIYYLLPNFANYSYITEAGHGVVPDPNAVVSALIYAVFYIAALLAAATLIFNRRNFK
jgi:hypothetical protein